jgi:hypothetical protein
MTKDSEFIESVLTVIQQHTDESAAKVAVERLLDSHVHAAKDAYGEVPDAWEHVRSDVEKSETYLPEINKQYPGQQGRIIEYAYEIVRAWRIPRQPKAPD